MKTKKELFRSSKYIKKKQENLVKIQQLIDRKKIIETQDKKKKKFKKELLEINFLLSYYKNDKKTVSKICNQGILKDTSFNSICESVYTKKDFLTDFKDYCSNLTAIYYTDYSNEKYRPQFVLFYFNIIDIISNYYQYKFYYNQELDENLVISKLFKKFLNSKKKDFCIIFHNKIDIFDYMHSNISVKIEDTLDFSKEINHCLKSKKKYLCGFIQLEDSLEPEHAYHANTFIISVENNKIYRLEPNFSIEESEKHQAQFKLDNFKLGIYPELKIEDYTNQALYDYFEKNEIIVNGNKLTFGGFFSTGTMDPDINHGGLCMFISVLQTHLKRNVTVRDIRKYTIKFFEWMFYKMFKKHFLLKKQNFYDTLKFIKREYSTTKSKYKLDNKSYTPFKEIKNFNFTKLSIKDLKIEELDKNKLVFMKPTLQDFKEIY